jgi:hypothetical protein
MIFQHISHDMGLYKMNKKTAIFDSSVKYGGCESTMTLLIGAVLLWFVADAGHIVSVYGLIR